jgi:Holliday junction resolvase-like predicted endonuclease
MFNVHLTMRIQQRNIEKIARKLNAYSKRQTQMHEQRIRFTVVAKRIVKRGVEFIECDYVGQNTSTKMPFRANEES